VLLTDPAFLFLFLPLLFVFYFPFATLAAPEWWASGPANLHKANLVLLLASLVFLVKSSGTDVWLPLGLVAVNCWVATTLVRAEIQRERWLALGVVANIAGLAAVRIGSRYSGAAGVFSLAIARQNVLSARVFVSIAVSIIALHGIAYLVDVYRREGDAQEGVVGTALYLLLFPFLSAGPIVRYATVGSELRRRVPALGGFAFGVRRFVIGLCMKLLIADTLGFTADAMFALSPSQLTVGRAWLGIACYTLQIYYALSGYSEMALGLGRMLGFRLPENFNWPYLAESVESFWKDWNISLVSWFRAYVYERLVEDRVETRSRRYGVFLAACLCFGLWHGAAWTFVAWVAFHAAFIALELAFPSVIGRLPSIVRHLYVLVVVACGWVIFRSSTLLGAFLYLKVMAGWSRATVPSLTVMRDITPDLLLALVIGAVGVAPLTSMLGRWRVAIDAATISAVGLLFTTALFTWRLLLNLRSFVFEEEPRKRVRR
jgi:alginate O-acetyltransferase complex protein AlgI